ncbi:hypothetical protein KM043_017051 [Ampulex compressa]|nr:hypothetical protein KM043_017051 [Ampulex compressa]
MTGIIRVVIVPKDYPNRKCSVSEAKQRRSKANTSALNLRTTSERDDTVVLSCTNEESEVWLKSLTTVKTLTRVQVRAVRVDELPNCQRIVVHVEEAAMPVRKVTDLFGSCRE